MYNFSTSNHITVKYIDKEFNSYLNKIVNNMFLPGTVAMGSDNVDECISMTLGIIVIAILLTITMIACGIAIAIFVRIQRKTRMVT